MQDYYQIFGLERSASERQIKRAYRELCKQNHPDRNQSPQANARMQELNEAYCVLSSPVKKAEYDQLLRLREQHGQTTTDGAAASAHTELCRCEKCGRTDSTLRVTVFTWVVSLLVVTYRRGWPKILCARCRIKYALLFDLQNFFMGWWGIPFGVFWTLEALWHNSMGGQQPEENNALLLAGLGYEFHRKRDLSSALKALKASLEFKKDPRVEAFYWQTKGRFYETPAAYTSERRSSLWQRLATGALHPAVYCAPMLAILFWLASLWLESDKKPSVRARSATATQLNNSNQGSFNTAENLASRVSATPASQVQANIGKTFQLAPGSASAQTAKVGDIVDLRDFPPEDQESAGVQLFDKQEYELAFFALRLAASAGRAKAQHYLALCYYKGLWAPQDAGEAAKWFRKAAEQGFAEAQFMLGICLLPSFAGSSAKDAVEAVKWYRKAAEQGYAAAQFRLGVYYENGIGVTRNPAEGVRWYRKAAEQGDVGAQNNLGYCYADGIGVPKDYVQAYKWLSLSKAEGVFGSLQELPLIEQLMTPEQIAQAQRLLRGFKPRKAAEPGDSLTPQGISDSNPAGTGTGFFITQDGFLVTNEHVVEEATQIRLVTTTGILVARVVKVDSANDLALLKAEGRFAPLGLATSRTVRLGNTVATVGFPNIGLQGFSPKLAKGEIAALSGAQDDPRYFQISVPVQPGNSGGALVDERGNVVGVVSAKLDAAAALTTSGALPENVNYAVKGSLLLSFLESVPEVSARLKGLNTKDRKFEDVVKDAEQASALVVVY